jgi:hypothetical protein
MTGHAEFSLKTQGRIYTLPHLMNFKNEELQPGGTTGWNQSNDTRTIIGEEDMMHRFHVAFWLENVGWSRLSQPYRQLGAGAV